MRATTDPKAYQKALEAYCQGMADGKGAKTLLKETGLSHAQADLAWYGSPLNPSRVEPNSIKLPVVPSKGDDGYEVALRRVGLIMGELTQGEHAAYPGRKLSWGYIAVATGTTESFCRRAFKATGLSDQGMRRGRGGRWLGDDPRGYVGNHKGHGIQAAQPRQAVTKEFVAKANEWEPELPKAVASLRKDLGGRTATRAKKAVAKKTTARKAPAKKAVAS